MTWMGHERIEETRRYVHVAEAHAHATPPEMLRAAEVVHDPDKRVLARLGAGAKVALQVAGAEVAAAVPAGPTVAKVGHRVGTSAILKPPARRRLGLRIDESPRVSSRAVVFSGRGGRDLNPRPPA